MGLYDSSWPRSEPKTRGKSRANMAYAYMYHEEETKREDLSFIHVEIALGIPFFY